MSESALLVYGLTTAEFALLRNALLDNHLPLLYQLDNSDAVLIGEQLDGTGHTTAAEEAESHLLILTQKQVPLLEQLSDIWRQLFKSVPDFVMLTTSNRDWTGERLLREISNEKELMRRQDHL
ncbi:MAG: DUF3783 domain-containing protein [Pirellulales bacterium]|nr:DUF3783 domain-containing protein [Pirellulales bacterium]